MIHRRRFVLLVAAGLFLGVAAVSSGEPETIDYGPLHSDPERMLRSVSEATLGFLRDDAAAARSALDVIHETGRALKAEERDHYGPDVLTSERGYRESLSRAREHAGAGELDEAFDMFVWVQRACRSCHSIARERGLYPRPVGE